jgi:NAD(P)-dependent dehydrogenase (short-subunit alcohol dehydrogenase family)
VTTPPRRTDDFLRATFGLDGRTALVTGASSGLGRSFAVTLARVGARLAIHGRDRARLRETRAAIEAEGGHCVELTADLRDGEACRRLVGEAHAALGRLDVLVNNAGMNRRAPIVEATQDDFDTIVATNLRSAFLLGQAAHPVMRDGGGGAIVNVGSITDRYGLGSVAVYGMTKAALAQLTRTMAVEWARDRIRVNGLSPGFIVTPLTEAPVWAVPQRRDWLLARIPAGRPGEPGDLAATLLLLASPASPYLTGEVIHVDGGFLAGGGWDLVPGDHGHG